MAVVINTGSCGQLGSGGGTSVTVSHTVSSGADRLFAAIVETQSGSQTAASYAGVSMTLHDTGGVFRVWHLVAPTSGANNFVITCAPSSNLNYCKSDWTGVDQTTPMGSASTGAATSMTPSTGSVTVPADGAGLGMFESAYASSGVTVSASGATTSLGGGRQPVGGQLIGGGYITATGPITWTFTGANRAWTARGYPINPATGGGTTIAPGVGHGIFTGYAPSIAQSANQTLTPGVGHGLFTSYAPSLSQSANQVVSPAAGHGIFAGRAPSLSQSVTISPGAGHGIFTGSAPTLAQTANQTVSPSTGHGIFTGRAPTLSQAAGRILSPGTGHGIFTGRAPSLLRSANLTVSPSTGHGIFTGRAPTLAQGPAVALGRSKTRRAYGPPLRADLLGPARRSVRGPQIRRRIAP